MSAKPMSHTSAQILHVGAVVQDSLAAMFATLFVDTPKIDMHLTDLEEKGFSFRRGAGSTSPAA